jgi:DNA-binding response OmpR family regulator
MIMSKRSVLVVEDDRSIRRGIVVALAFARFQVLEADNGDDGKRLGVQAGIDIVLLDLVLPGPDGFEILGAIRQSRPTLPVIILTAMGDEDSRVRGLKEGADDYVVKPFSVKELLARIEAVLRRSPERPTDIESISVPGATIHLERRELRFDSGDVGELSEREVDLLRYLASNPGRPISREEILSRVWRISPNGVETRTIDMHIARLREKFSDGGVDPKIIATIRGKGYMYAGEETA